MRLLAQFVMLCAGFLFWSIQLFRRLATREFEWVALCLLALPVVCWALWSALDEALYRLEQFIEDLGEEG